MGVKTLYIVVAILFASLTLFFLGQTDFVPQQGIWSIGKGTYDLSRFFDDARGVHESLQELWDRLCKELLLVGHRRRIVDHEE